MMCPKIIHFCWFGRKPYSSFVVKCIESWKINLPNYKIKEWNENNFDLDMYPYVREAYNARKFAFVSDVVRLYALYHEGGIYLDTDVEVLKSLDSLLKYDIAMGFEAKDRIQTAVIVSRINHPFVRDLLREYENISFFKPDGSFDLTPNVDRITKACLKNGLCLNNLMQTRNGITLLPKDYLCPKSLVNRKIYITENTLVIHHFDGSWLPLKQKIKLRIQELLGGKITKLIIKIKSQLRMLCE